jgi:hypothetical protein
MKNKFITLFISATLIYLGLEILIQRPGLTYEIDRESIIYSPNLDEEKTYPEINNSIIKNLSEAQYSRLFWGLAKFTKATGIRVEFPSEQGVETLTASQIENILLELNKFKPYAIALNLNRSRQKIDLIRIHGYFRKNGAAYNGKTLIWMKADDFRLSYLLHELLHSVDPFRYNESETRKCMEIVFGDDAFNTPTSSFLSIYKRRFSSGSSHIIRDTNVATDDANSGRLPYLSKSGYFVECFPEVGETLLSISSFNKKYKVAFFDKFLAMLSVNSFLYSTPEFRNTYMDLLSKGEEINSEDIEDFTNRFQNYWRSIREENLTIFLDSSVKNYVNQLQSKDINMGRND